MSLDSNKIACFEFMMDELVAWVTELGGNPKTDLNLLKVIKLNFFIAAASSSESEKGLLEVFDNFHAMPYGHVESSVYDAVKGNGMLSKYNIFPKEIFYNSDEANYLSKVSLQNKILIKNSINLIKTKDPDFVQRSPLYLVNLSHEWRSWRVMYNMAKAQKKHSIKIPLNLIQTDTKVFILNNGR